MKIEKEREREKNNKNSVESQVEIDDAHAI